MKTTKIILSIALMCLSMAVISATHNVTISSNTFTPSVLNIEAGDTVVFTNTGGFHNVKADDGSFRCSTNCEEFSGDGNGAPSSSLFVTEITFDSVGSFNYFCQIHGGIGGAGMSGVINVVAPTTGTIHEVRSENFQFTPNDLVIQEGDFVNFINDEGFHNIKADNDSFECSQGCSGSNKILLSSANSDNWNVFVRFNTVSTNRYYCEPHGSPGGVGMAGVIRVFAEDNIFTDGFE